MADDSTSNFLVVIVFSVVGLVLSALFAPSLTDMNIEEMRSAEQTPGIVASTSRTDNH
jgi:hypothetical protein